MTEARLADLDLAALLCSRVCHDVISPVGAIANGLELYDDPEMDEETRQTALDMVRSSARTASAKLKFCRIAFGAAGSAGASIDMGEAGETAMAFVGSEKVKLDWLVPRENRPKQQVKLVLNMLLMAMAGVPRGGTVIDLGGRRCLHRACPWRQGQGAGSHRPGRRRDGRTQPAGCAVGAALLRAVAGAVGRTETDDEHGWRRRCRSRVGLIAVRRRSGRAERDLRRQALARMSLSSFIGGAPSRST